MRELTGRNPDVVVMTAENRAPMRKLATELGDRFIDVGIAEQTLIGASAGLALRGRIPIVHAFSSFLTMRAFEFIRTDIGVGGLPVKLFGAMSGFLSEANGPTHQALEDIALMRGIPGMHVVCPADAEDLLCALDEIIASPKPCYVRYTSATPAAHHVTDFEFGRAETVLKGKDIAILTYGLLLREAVKAAELLAAEDVSVRLLNMRSLVPIDEAAILRAAEETRMIVTIEDHFRTGGLFSVLAELLAVNRVACDVLPIALEDRWFKPALLNEALEFEGFTGPQLAGRILDHYRAAYS